MFKAALALPSSPTLPSPALERSPRSQTITRAKHLEEAASSAQSDLFSREGSLSSPRLLATVQVETSGLQNPSFSLPLCTDLSKHVQVIERLERQQNIITPGAIQKALEKNFPDPSDRDLALKILTQMTCLANMGSLNRLQSALALHRKKTSENIYYQGEGTLGSTLNYLVLKHKTASTLSSPFGREALTEIKDLKQIQSGAILLDQPTKIRLAKDPKLCEHIRQQEIKLLYPPAWDEGIIPFNQPSLDVIMNKLPPIMKNVKRAQVENDIKADDAIKQVLSQPTRELISRLNLAESLILIEPFTPYLSPGSREKIVLPTEKIAQQLAPKKLCLEDLQAALSKSVGKTEGIEARLVLKILDEQAEVYSPSRLTQFVQEQHQTISSRAKHLGIQPQNIIYYIDEKKKSYGLINYQYAQVNNMGPDQFVDEIDALPKSQEQQLVVVLDDLASSGDSLVDVYNKLREKLDRNTYLHFAPLVSTNKAAQVFKDIEHQDSRCTYEPSQIVTLFRDQPLYKNASPDLKRKLENAVIHLGHRENGLSLAFPYMAPDNNNAFFARHIAPLFTLNQAGCKDIAPEHLSGQTHLLGSKTTPAPQTPKLNLQG